MAYRNKTYVAFDGDTDIKYYRTMQMWKQNDNTDFNWDVGETAEFQGQPATLIAAGTAVAGVSLNIPFVIDLSIELSSPVLTGIVECPTLRRDGSLLTASGYDAASGLYVDYAGSPVAVPEFPTRTEALAALAESGLADTRLLQDLALKMVRRDS